MGKGYRYAGNTDSGRGAYTEPILREIHIGKYKSEEEAALSYIYETKNAQNEDNYCDIYARTEIGSIKDGKEFAQEMMNLEVEAIEHRIKVAIESGLESMEDKDIVNIVKNVREPLERRKQILEWAEGKGRIDETNPFDYYEKQFSEKYGEPHG